jgi:hypothetical protein
MPQRLQRPLLGRLRCLERNELGSTAAGALLLLHSQYARQQVAIDWRIEDGGRYFWNSWIFQEACVCYAMETMIKIYDQGFLFDWFRGRYDSISEIYMSKRKYESVSQCCLFFAILSV